MNKAQQSASSMDLAKRIFEIYSDEKLAVDDQNKSRLISLFSSFDLESSSSDEFARLSLKWAGTVGSTQLNHSFGSLYYNQGYYYDAGNAIHLIKESHFIHGDKDSAKSLAKMIWEWSLENYCSDCGYFLARSVLQLLCLGRVEVAFVVIKAFLVNMKEKNESSCEILDDFYMITSSDLANAAQLFALAVLKGNKSIFMQTANAFQKALSVDSFLVQVKVEFDSFSLLIKQEKLISRHRRFKIHWPIL